jgi:hypothetical protein
MRRVWHKQSDLDRLERMRNARKDGPIDRAAIIARDNGICYLCGCRPTGDDLTLDHVIPLDAGGSHTADNLRVCCRSCNSLKGAASEEEARAWLMERKRRGDERKRREDEWRRVEAARKQIKAALRELEDIEGWAEERKTIVGHLTHASKRARELEQKMWVSQ